MGGKKVKSGGETGKSEGNPSTTIGQQSGPSLLGQNKRLVPQKMKSAYSIPCPIPKIP